MTSKTISVTENVYNLLKRMRLRGESFGDTIARLCGTKTSISLRLWAQSSAGWSDLTPSELAKLEGALEAIRATLRAQEVGLS